MITVYRIEGPDGNGLFRSMTNMHEYLIRKHPNWVDIESRHMDFDKFPTPWKDDKLNKNYIHLKIFAYNNKRRVNQAITKEEMKIAMGMGFKVFRIKVNKEDCSQSPFQTVLYRSKIIQKKDVTQQFI